MANDIYMWCGKLGSAVINIKYVDYNKDLHHMYISTPDEPHTEKERRIIIKAIVTGRLKLEYLGGFNSHGWTWDAHDNVADALDDYRRES